jgi:hypothetical protein
MLDLCMYCLELWTQSKLNLDFIKFTNDLFGVTSMLKSPHNKIGVSMSGFMLGNINLMASE